MLATAVATQMMADNEWLHIYRNDKNFSTKRVSEIEQITYKAGNDGTYTSMTVSGATSTEDITVSLSAISTITRMR